MRGSEASGEATRGNLRPGISIDSTSCRGLFPKIQEGGGGGGGGEKKGEGE